MKTTSAGKGPAKRLCRSISENPGQFGLRFFGHLFDRLSLPYAYERHPTRDIAEAIQALREDEVRGAAIAMPYKVPCMKLLDGIDSSALRIGAVNTIVNDGGRLTGYNTDFLAVRNLLRERQWDASRPFVLRGSGGMARAILFALKEHGFSRGTVVSRNPGTGSRLASDFGFVWEESFPSEPEAYLLNATPIGMKGRAQADEVAFPEALIARAPGVLDSVASPPETPLVRLARRRNRPVVLGSEIIVLQAVEQFVLYIGTPPPPELVRVAAELALV